MDSLWTRIAVRLGMGRPTGLAQAVTALQGDEVAELPAEPERPWGCGWFDSSLDLREGLAVIEHAGVDLHLAVARMLCGPGEAGGTGGVPG